MEGIGAAGDVALRGGGMVSAALGQSCLSPATLPLKYSEPHVLLPSLVTFSDSEDWGRLGDPGICIIPRTDCIFTCFWCILFVFFFFAVSASCSTE